MKKLSVFNLSAESFQADPLPVVASMREAGEVVLVKVPVLGTIHAVTSYAAVDQLLRDTKRFTRDGRLVGKGGPAGLRWWMPKIFRAFTENMLATDGEDHRRLRSLVDQAFFKRNVDSMKVEIEAIADRLLDEMQAKTSRNEPVDLMVDFARQFPLAVICELLGLPDADRPKFTKWFAPFGNINSSFSLVQLVPGLFRIRNYLKSEFRRVRQNPQTGLISELVLAEQDGGRLSENELLAMVFLLLVAGHETTTHLISDGVLMFFDHPDQMNRLKSDWTVASSAVDEVLRFACPVQMTKIRYVMDDMDLHGHQMKRGELIIGLLISANFDPVQFEQPEIFDITRSPNRHLSFGSGIHVCLGLKLAKMEASIAWQRLWTRFPNLQLAVPREEIRWKSRIGLRCLKSLPVRLE